jgi:hypothetical protein
LRCCTAPPCRLACIELLPLLALATIPHGSSINKGGSASSKSGSNSSIAGEVLSVLAMLWCAMSEGGVSEGV